ncbi:MAG: hypothetical protein JF886_04805 [Candidatus Dormibacteraeota bacterium]|uniref:Glycosyltransferase RgtA/B/C/D-like domain-containing protein n=1 Tax=Candidatus Aeolococcus gillhamiae TaxID=3127015 RepID=A0A934JW81_9BACT|nr:hypothetical protein [Candidatus Dormibacteraeota bacterium]
MRSPEDSAADQTRTRRRTHALVLVGFLLLALAIFLPADLHATSVMIGATTADNSQHAWFLRWFPYALATHHNPLFTTNLIAPGGVNLMWNTWIPLPALLLSPLTLLLGPVASFDIAVTLGVALSAWCASLAASRFLRRRWAAVLAGAAYGFSPFIFDQSYTGHSNMVIAVVPPLMLLLLDTILVRQTTAPRRAGLLFGALMIAQFFITEELLASEMVLVIVGITSLALMHRRALGPRWRHVAACFGWALALFIPVVAYPVWFQFFGPQVPHQLIADKNFFVTDLLNVFLPSTAQGVEPSFARDIASHYAGNSGEWGGYVGIPMLAVVAWTARQQWRRPLVRVLCISAAAAVVLSFGSTLHVGGSNTHIPLPAAILAHLPVLDNLVPARFAVYVALFTALLFGVFVDSLPARRGSARVVMLVTVLIAAAFVPPLPFPTRAAVTPAFFTASHAPLVPGSTVLVVPFSHDFYSTQAVLWQAEAGMWFSMPEGYIINRQPSGAAAQGPPSSVTGSTLMAIAAGKAADATVDAPTRRSILGELRTWNISAVVLGPMDQHGAEMRTFLADLLGAAPVDRDGVAVWSSVPPPA